jgi:hypothetical protein
MTEDVDANAYAIVSNTDAGDANAASIEANVAVGGANTVAIAANTVGIEANGEAFATHAAAIATNTTGVATNNALISSNADGVAANNDLIVDHGEAIIDISEVSSDNQSAIRSMEDFTVLGDYLSVDTDNHAIHFVGADVYIQNGSDDTAAEGDRGGGNLFIGYDGGDAAGKTGWHNFVIGDGHSYTESAVAFMQDANADTVVANTAEVQSSLTVYDHAYFYMAPAAFIVYDSPFYGW